MRTLVAGAALAFTVLLAFLTLYVMFNSGPDVLSVLSLIVLDAALAVGVTMVDTANGYAGGATETILGSLLADRSVAVG